MVVAPGGKPADDGKMLVATAAKKTRRRSTSLAAKPQPLEYTHRREGIRENRHG